MYKFSFIYSVLLSLLIFPAYAQILQPPLTDQMSRMEILKQPIPLAQTIIKSPEKEIYLSDFAGKLIVLNIWATWCPPCVEEMPTFNALQEHYGKDKLVVVPVSLEKDVMIVKTFMDSHHLTQLMPYVDSNEDILRIQALKGVQGVPVTLIINQNMEVIARFQGDADWNSKYAHDVFDYFLENALPDRSSEVNDMMRNLGR